MRGFPKHIFDEAEEVVKWVRERLPGKVCSVIVYGSAIRGWREKPEDLDVLIVVDVPQEEALKAKLAFVGTEINLKLSDKYGLYPEVIILSKEEIGRGSASFYYSVVHDGVPIYGGKDIFIEALKRTGGSLERKFLKSVEEGKTSLSNAYEFLEMAAEDFGLFKKTGRKRRLQSSAENAFRAMIEAIYALFRKHGLPTPRSHEEKRRGLTIIKEIYPRQQFQARYEEIFITLHDECFYHGRCPENMDDWIKKVKLFIKSIEDVL